MPATKSSEKKSSTAMVFALDSKELTSYLAKGLSGGKGTRAIWTDVDSKVLVDLEALSVQLKPGFILCSLPMFTDQTGTKTMTAAFCIGASSEEAVLMATTDELPYGDALLAARWGKVLQEGVWNAVINAGEARLGKERSSSVLSIAGLYTDGKALTYVATVSVSSTDIGDYYNKGVTLPKSSKGKGKTLPTLEPYMGKGTDLDSTHPKDPSTGKDPYKGKDLSTGKGTSTGKDPYKGKDLSTGKGTSTGKDPYKGKDLSTGKGTSTGKDFSKGKGVSTSGDLSKGKSSSQGKDSGSAKGKSSGTSGKSSVSTKTSKTSGKYTVKTSTSKSSGKYTVKTSTSKSSGKYTVKASTSKSSGKSPTDKTSTRKGSSLSSTGKSSKTASSKSAYSWGKTTSNKSSAYKWGKIRYVSKKSGTRYK